MPIFINTRPSERAKPLTQALQQSGVEVVELPLLEMKPIELSLDDEQKLQALQAGEYDVLVVVSPTAGQLGCQKLGCQIASEIEIEIECQIQTPNQSLNQNQSHKVRLLPSTQIVAVGDATASTLAEFGLSAIVPTTASNEGMLALASIQQLNASNKVMIWRGQGGRKLLVDVLQDKGVQVDIVELYQRQLPVATMENYRNWIASVQLRNQQISNKQISNKQLKNKQKQEITVLITSGEAFENWQKVVQQPVSEHKKTMLSDFNYIVLGERLASKLSKLQLTVTQVDSLTPVEMIATLNNS